MTAGNGKPVAVRGQQGVGGEGKEMPFRSGSCSDALGTRLMTASCADDLGGVEVVGRKLRAT